MIEYITCSICRTHLDPEFDEIYPISFSNGEQTWTENGCKNCAKKIKYDTDDYHYSSVIADTPNLNNEEDEQ
jgi:5-methylcytosine-specific restriction endonuclease McrA